MSKKFRRFHNTTDVKTMLRRIAASFRAVTRLHARRFARRTRRHRRVYDIIGTRKTTHAEVEKMLADLKADAIVDKTAFKFTVDRMMRNNSCHRNIFDQEGRYLAEQLKGELLNRADASPVLQIDAKTGKTTRHASISAAAKASGDSRDAIRAALDDGEREDESDGEGEGRIRWRRAPPLQAAAFPTESAVQAAGTAAALDEGAAVPELITTEMRDPGRVTAKGRKKARNHEAAKGAKAIAEKYERAYSVEHKREYWWHVDTKEVVWDLPTA